jgi:hypothetical protein
MADAQLPSLERGALYEIVADPRLAADGVSVAGTPDLGGQDPKPNTPATAADRTKLIEAVMNDPKLTPAERLEKVRAIAAGEPAKPPTEPTPPPADPTQPPGKSGEPSASPSFDPQRAATAFDAALNPPTAIGVSFFGWGTDKDGLNSVFNGLTRRQFDQVVGAYRDVYKRDLRDALQEELGDEHAEFLKSHPVLKMTSADTVAAEIRAALNPGVLSAINVAALTELVLQVPGSELAEIPVAYETRYGGTLSADVAKHGEGLALLVSGDRPGYFAHRLNEANSISDLGTILGRSDLNAIAPRYKELFGRELNSHIALKYSEEIHKRLDLGGVGGWFKGWYGDKEKFELATVLLDIPESIRTTVAATYQDRFGEPFSKAVGKVGTGWELLGRGERVEGVQVLVQRAHSPEVVESLLKRLTPAEMTEYRKIADEDLQVYHGRNAAFEPVTLAGLKHMVAGYPNGVGVAKLRSVVVSGHLAPIAENVESIPEGALPGVLADYRAIVGKSFLESAQERLSAEDFKKLRDRLQPRLPVDPAAPK